MPERKTRLLRFDAAAVQGEGAYVEFRTLTWGELKELQVKLKQTDSGSDQQLAEVESVLLKHVAAWNWVDEAGQPMPVPTDLAGLHALTTSEMMFLSKQVRAFVAGPSETSAEGPIKN